MSRARRSLRVGRSASLGNLHDLRKRAGIADREVRQDLPVDPDVGGLQAADELAVGEALAPDRGVDADEQEAAQRALPRLAVAGRIGHRVEEGLARRLDQPRLRALAALRGVEEALVPPMGGDAPLDPCHDRLLLSLEVRQQALDLLRVEAADERLAGVPTRSPR